jgi:hypothetical protein
MATRDCIGTPNAGLRNYPTRPNSGLHLTFLPAHAVRETDPDIGNELLGRFSDARCFLQCATTALIARDEHGFYSPELVCLRHGLEMLRGVYNDLDLRLLREPSPPR